MELRWLLFCVALATVGTLPILSSADEEVANRPRVSVDADGRCYAKSVPDSHSGQHGVTRVYRVKAGRDELADTYPWYSRRIYLYCGMRRISVVRFGPWSRGHRASDEQFAFAFYFGGELLARYSTLDIAGSPDNVEWSFSHYWVIRRVKGYRWIDSNDLAFDIETVDGRVLSFNPVTGKPLPPPE